MDVFKIAEILVDNVKRKYADDIAIVAYYGSYALGTANAKSDLDFFFIPNNDKGYEACLQFILDDIGFDFWPISWERAEGMAAFNEAMVTIIADAKILYSRSAEDLARFNKLRDKILAIGKPENRKTMLDKAFAYLKECYLHIYNLQMPASKENLASARMEAYKLITKVLQSLAFVNQTYFTRGWGQNMDQVLTLKIKPDNLESLLNIIMKETNYNKIYASCDELLTKTREILLTQQELLAAPQRFSDALTGFYEEAKGTFNKIITACENEDYATAFFASLSIQNEISQVLGLVEQGIWHNDFSTYDKKGNAYETFNLPDLAAIVAEGKLDSLKAAVNKLDEIIQNLLKSRGVPLTVFTTLDEFKQFILNR